MRTNELQDAQVTLITVVATVITMDQGRKGLAPSNSSRSPSRHHNDGSQIFTKADLSKLFDTKLAEAVAKASHDGYMRGRREAEDEGGEKWIPPVDSKLVAKARALEYISLTEIKRQAKA